MSEKIGRNDPCWCGSGKKYKKCHLEADKNPARLNELEKERRKNFSVKTCLAPFEDSCSKNIVKAHTVSKASLLKIATEGHVYQFEIDAYKQLNYLRKNGIEKEDLESFQPNNPNINVLRKDFLEPVVVGVNIASTFNGFCDKHDNEIFAALENKKFVDSDEQYFLLFYRALCRKIYSLSALLRTRFDHNHKNFFKGLDLRDLINIKKEMDESLIKKNYDRVHWISIKTDRAPFFMVNEIFSPKFDCNAEKIENIKMKNPFDDIDWIVKSSFTYQNESRIAFIWFGDSNGSAKSLIASLFDGKDISLDKIFSVAISSCENVYFSIKWWDNLSITVKKIISDKYNEGTGENSNPDQFKPMGISMDDCMRCIEIIRRY